MDGTYEYKKVTDMVMNVYRIRVYDGHPKGGWYRQLTSLSAFASNILDYWYNTYRSNQMHQLFLDVVIVLTKKVG